MTRQGGLGRGLGALIPSAEVGEAALVSVKVSAIVANPRQPRTTFDEEGLRELADSLREVGLLQPVIVRPLEGGSYELIAGERRVRAARLAEFEEIPAVVRRTDESELLTEALVENLHRTDLNPLEEAAAYQQLLEDFGMTHDGLAGKLGKSRSAISNSLRLMSLPPGLQNQVAAGELSAGHARALLALDGRESQERLGRKVVAEGWSVRQTEQAVRAELSRAEADRNGGRRGSGRGGRSRASSPYEGLQRRLTDALSTRVQITGSANRGRLVIDYAGQEDLERLLAILSDGAGEDLLSEPS